MSKFINETKRLSKSLFVSTPKSLIVLTLLQPFLMQIEEMTYANLIDVQQLNIRNLPENYTMQYYTHHMVYNPGLNFIYKDGDKIVGYILGKEDFEGTYKGHLVSICVDIQYRKKGIAKCLINKLISCFQHKKIEKKQDIYMLNLKVRPSNEIAIKLYEKIGFILENVEKNYYCDGEAANNMVKKIE